MHSKRRIIRKLSHIDEHLIMAIKALHKNDHAEVDYNIKMAMGMVRASLTMEKEARRENDKVAS